jgi:hypothetical protein
MGTAALEGRSVTRGALDGLCSQIAAHESPRTTKLYDRTSDELTLDEIERIRI